MTRRMIFLLRCQAKGDARAEGKARGQDWQIRIARLQFAQSDARVFRFADTAIISAFAQIYAAIIEAQHDAT